MQKYANPLRQPESATLVDIQTVDEIFFMVPSILNIHEKFLEELGKRLEEWDPMQRIGDAYYEVVSCFSRLTGDPFLNHPFFAVFKSESIRNVHSICEQLEQS